MLDGELRTDHLGVGSLPLDTSYQNAHGTGLPGYDGRKRFAQMGLCAWRDNPGVIIKLRPWSPGN
jgi:hypothetical protein